MRGKGVWFGALALVVLAMALGYAAWRLRPSAGETCYACNRPVHGHSKTVALANGRSRLFCCPACALSQHEQAGKPVNITRLTAFLTGEPLSPDQAYLVEGSDVNMCATKHTILETDKQHAELQYDRCAPSMLAFARRDEAAQFAREHGGRVASFREIAAGFSK
jgi:NosL